MVIYPRIVLITAAAEITPILSHILRRLFEIEHGNYSLLRRFFEIERVLIYSAAFSKFKCTDNLQIANYLNRIL